MSSGQSSHGCSGFTLVELVVATGITVVLAALLISITSGMLSAWNQSRGRLTSSNQAKLGLDQIAEDLAGLVLRTDGNVWLAATVSGTQTGTGDAGVSDATYSTSKPTAASISDILSPASGELADYRFGHVGVWLRFFANQPDANGAPADLSTIRALSYQIVRLPVSSASGNPPRYFLFRSAVRASSVSVTESGYTRSTFTTGYNIVGENAYNDPDGQLANDGAEPGRIRRPIRALVIGNDVIDFGVRIYVRNASGVLIERFPVDRAQGTPPEVLSFVATSASSVTLYGVGTPPTGVSTVVRDFPAVIEVMMRVLSDEGAQLIVALETGKVTPPGGAGNYDAYWWELANAHSTVYTRRIEIQCSALPGTL